MSKDHIYLKYILENIKQLEDYVSKGKQSFFADSMIQDASVRKLHIITESTQRLSEDIKYRYPEIPWRMMAGFRNIIVHDYLGIDLEQVWQVIDIDIPVLKTRIYEILLDFED